MLPLTLAFGASIAWGASDFLGGLASRRIPVAAQRRGGRGTRTSSVERDS